MVSIQLIIICWLCAFCVISSIIFFSNFKFHISLEWSLSSLSACFHLKIGYGIFFFGIFLDIYLSIQPSPLHFMFKISCNLLDQPRQHIKKQRHYIAKRGPSSQGYGFSSSHVWMWELDCKESWAPKNLCFWTVMLEKTLKEGPLDCKELQPVHPKD